MSFCRQPLRDSMESWLVQYRQLIMLSLRQSGSGINRAFFSVSAAPSLGSREIQIRPGTLLGLLWLMFEFPRNTQSWAMLTLLLNLKIS